MRLPRLICGFILILLALVPLTTLFHHDDLGRWDVQRSAMAAPDEFSYLLMAQHFLHGGGLSLQADLGRDTFYPPGYPLLLAAWGKCFGLTAFTAHVLNTLLISAGTIVIYFFCRRLLLQLAQTPYRSITLSPKAASLLALLIASLFATNWHVLETSLLIMSEPAFMLATFAWLASALKWPDWPTHPLKALAIVLLAVCAWSIRGAGIVCVATTVIYPLLDWLRQPPPRLRRTFDRLGPLALTLALPLAYQIVMAATSREKSLVSGQESNNSYPRQLLRGLLVDVPGPNDPHPWLTLATAWSEHVYYLFTGHLKDYASTFVPWPREDPDFYFRVYIGRILGTLGFIGWLFHASRLFRRSNVSGNAPQPANGFLEIYIVLYVGLYLVWPFNFARFWSPILPIMLVYAADTVMRFRKHLPSVPRVAPAGILLTLLLILSAEEIYLQLGFYARRLNYVSDALRDGVRKIIKTAPDPRQALVTGMGDDELYALAWYFSQEPGGGGGGGYHIRAPEPHLASKGGKYERADEMLLRSAAETRAAASNQSGSFFFFSYFPGADARDTLASFRAQRPGDEVTKIYQKEAVISVWLIQTKPALTQGQTPTP